MRLHVEVNGETVWSGNGDSYKDIPAEWRDRPSKGGTLAEEYQSPYPPAHHLYEGKELAGVQMSLGEERDHTMQNGTDAQMGTVVATRRMLEDQEAGR